MTHEIKLKRTITKRLHHSPEVWAQAKRDYLAGYSASAVSKRYGVSVDAMRKRASVWRRRRCFVIPGLRECGEPGS